MRRDGQAAPRDQDRGGAATEGGRAGPGVRGPRILTGVRLTQPGFERLQQLHRHYLRGVRNCRKAILRRCDLQGLDFTGMDFSHAEFMACAFGGAMVHSAKFRCCQLFAARFEGADLRAGALIDGETNHVGGPVEATFRGATLRDTNLAHSKLKNAIFNGAVLNRVNLANADMRDTRFQGAEIVGATLTGARLANADLRGASLAGTDLKNIDLSAAKTASDAGLTDSWLRARLDNHAEWVKSAGQMGERADFTGLDLSGRDLANATLAAAVLEAATLVGANLSGALLAAANLRGANLLRADLSGADLRGADLLDTNMRDADFTGCRTGELPGTALMTLLRREAG